MPSHGEVTFLQASKPRRLRLQRLIINPPSGSFNITAATINDSALRTSAASLAQAQTRSIKRRGILRKRKLVAPIRLGRGRSEL